MTFVYSHNSSKQKYSEKAHEQGYDMAILFAKTITSKR